MRAGGGEREVEYVASEESEQRVVRVLEALVLEQVLEEREHVLGTLACQVLAATRQEVHQTLVYRPASFVNYYTQTAHIVFGNYV